MKIFFHPKIADAFVAATVNPYKFMKQVGFSPPLISRIKETSGIDTPCPWWELFVADRGVDLISRYRDTKTNKVTTDRFMKSFEKCDVNPVCPDNPAFDLALQYTKRMLYFMRNSSISSEVEFNMAASCGKPYTQMGFPTKRELIDSPIFMDELKRRHVPIWSVSPKPEYLPMDDLARDKLRTYFIPETPFLAHQKIWFDDQNDRMKKASKDLENFWIRYGFTKQFGGFPRIMKAHNRFNLHFTTDGTGWDRVLSVMRKIYDQRKDFFDQNIFIDPKCVEYFNFVAENTCAPFCALPDGRIVQRFCGNGSGSNNTTTDNCWAHLMMVFYITITLYADSHDGVFPEYEFLIKNNLFSLYGDDNLGSLDSDAMCPNMSLEDFKTFITARYLEFGVVCKSSQFECQTGSVEGLEFLGSRAIWHPRYGCFVPRPRIGKLTTSITCRLEEKTPVAVANSIVAFYTLVGLVPKNEERIITAELRHYANFLLRIESFTENLDVSSINQLIRVSDGTLNLCSEVLGYESSDNQVLPMHVCEGYYPQSSFFSPGTRKVEALKMMENNIKIEKKKFKEIDISSFTALRDSGKDSVSILNELVQLDYISSPKYVSTVVGPSHIPTFTVKVNLEWSFGEVAGIGTASTRRIAQKNAANEILTKIVPPKKQEFLNLTNKDLICFVACLKDLMSFEANNWQNPLDDIINMSNDVESAARLAQMFKEGSFNPYGNGMIYIPEKEKIINVALSGARVAQMLKVGSFNPYGNGMLLTKQQYLLKNKAAFDKQKLSKSERATRFIIYLRNNNARAVPKKKQKNFVREMNDRQNAAVSRVGKNAVERVSQPIHNNSRLRGLPTKNHFPFSQCALNYAQALLDPWAVSNPPCVPDPITLPSFKFGARIRGNFVLGAAGAGYVIASPYYPSGNTISLYYVSGSLYATQTFGGLLEAGTTSATSDSPFTNTQFSVGGASYRPVGSGLATRYVGNEQTRGGQMVLYRTSQNQLVPTGTTQNLLLNNNEATTVPVDRDWHYVTWKPAVAQDTAYTFGFPVNQFPLIIFVFGGTAAMSFEFDFITWFEVIGTDVPALTPSSDDTLGYAVIKSGIAVPQPPDSPASNFRRFIETVADIADETLSFIGRGSAVATRTSALLNNVGLL